MSRARTLTADVVTLARALVRREAEREAGANRVLSRAEQARATPEVRAAAEALRAQGATRVTVDALDAWAGAEATRLIAQVNVRGPTTLSRAEATAARQREAGVGGLVLRAYELASGHGFDVDAVASERARAQLADDAVFKTFATVAEAERYADPDGRRVVWLVAEGAGLLEQAYVWGRDDLWAERFAVDRLSGAVTVTGEH